MVDATQTRDDAGVPGYSSDTALVSPAWAQQHLDDPNVRFVEVDVDTAAYEQSHLPGAVGWNWTSQLADGIRRDIMTRNPHRSNSSGAATQGTLTANDGQIVS